MKHYQDVVKTRYGDGENFETSIYAPHHPIGKYSRKVIFNGLDDFIKKYRHEKGELKSKKLLDVGCGNGGMLAYFSSRGFSIQNLTGIDLSKSRIAIAKKENPGIRFLVGNGIDFNLHPEKFDLITAFDLFSHFHTREQIISGLQNIKNHLADDGWFLWYDIYSKDHFNPLPNVDSSGFSKEQMYDLAQASGFEIVYEKKFFKQFFNKYHSLYQARRLPYFVLRILEKTLPGMPGNFLVVGRRKGFKDK